MTEEELDLLASSYLDGEATPSEVAMVDDDPALQARVEELRSILRGVEASTPAPPPELFRQHLSAALTEYDAVIGAATADAVVSGTAESSATGNVVELGKRVRVSRRDRLAQNAPQWLAAAAGFVLIGGGALYVASATGGNDESADFETASVEQSSDGDDAAGDDAAFDDADEAFESEATLESADGAANTGAAAAAESLADEGFDDSGRTFDADEDASAEDAADAPATTTTETAVGLFQPPLIFLDEVPDPDQLLDELNQPPLELGTSVCVDSLELPDGSEVVSYVPLEITAAPAELFETIDSEGNRVAVLVDQNCEPLEP